jgi:hypothetical protein
MKSEFKKFDHVHDYIKDQANEMMEIIMVENHPKKLLIGSQNTQLD